jgi:hypothetical protein
MMLATYWQRSKILQFGLVSLNLSGFVINRSKLTPKGNGYIGYIGLVGG